MAKYYQQPKPAVKTQYRTGLFFSLEVTSVITRQVLSSIKHAHLEQIIFKHPDYTRMFSLRWSTHYSDTSWYDMGLNYEVNGVEQLPFDDNLWLMMDVEGLGDASHFDDVFNPDTLTSFTPVGMRVKFLKEDGTPVDCRKKVDIFTIYTYQDSWLKHEISWSQEGFKFLDLSSFQVKYKPVHQAPFKTIALEQTSKSLAELPAPSRLKQAFKGWRKNN